MIYLLTSRAVIIVLVISGVPLIASSISGLIISILQTATSIQDQTISYVVKLSTLVLTIIFCGNWFLSQILELITQTLAAIVFVGV